MTLGLFTCIFSHKPQGDLTYCSYARRGAAGLGSEYCELIADTDSIPKVVVVLNEGNRFGDPVIKREYPVEKSVVDSLAQLLANHKVYTLNGYHVEEPITGGHSYRIHMEYTSGDHVTADWYGNHISDKAIAAFNLIERFFTPWYSLAASEGQEVQEAENVQ